MNKQALKVYTFCDGRLDVNKADKIIDGIERGLITKENYHDYVSDLTKNVKSKASRDRWNELQEFIYKTYFSK